MDIQILKLNAQKFSRPQSLLIRLTILNQF
jgi:hypothetical protein